ncbi:MAG: efflux RND transporter permease subunit [Deferribacteres bacterium]|nr:efflux RND transporter permease subunit [candidate division KSB1 bacterium]MCB9500740.1 efflux RND transporter permease subunit [Deferribacteres bacterium]
MTNKQGSFYSFTTSRPVAILMIVIGVCVFGFISYKQLAVNLMPDISYPSLTVRTEYAGTAPEEIETSISRPIEQALGVVNNVVSISSISKAGLSDAKLEFTWDTDMNRATSDVREKLDQVFLPDEVERPLILRYDPTLDPIMRLGLYGDKSLTRMRYRAEEGIKRILETVPGVAAVKVKGGLEEEIRVELNEQKLTLIGIDIQQVKQRLQQENVNLAGGNLKEGDTEYLVRTLNEFKTVDEIADVVVGNYNDREIKVQDIARVIRTNKEREIITRINGKESVEIEVFKEADENIVSVAERVKNIVFGTPEQQAFVKNLREQERKAKEEKKEDKGTESKAESTNGQSKPAGGPGNDMLKLRMTNFIAYDLPDSTQIETLSDQSIFIQNSVDEVKSTAIIGGILAIIVLFIFLRKFSATVIIGIAIPISIIATFAPMKIFGVSLNIMSLGGLALGIGMLVDNSIVVLESIARCRDEGDDLIRATIRGVSEVGGAVFASTLTTIAVFFPIVFVEGVAGQIFGDMALTVVFSLLASLAVALFLIPMLSSRDMNAFASQSRLNEILKRNILFFKSEEEYRKVLARGSEASIQEKFVAGLKNLALTPLYLLLKVVEIVAALLLVFLKALALLVLVIFSPLVALFFVFRKSDFSISSSTISFAENPVFLKASFVQEIWASLLVFESIKVLYESFAVRRQKFNEGSIWKKIWHTFMMALPIFAVIKFFVYFFLELLGKVFHLLFTLFALLIKAFVNIIKLIFTVPALIIVTLFNIMYGYLERTYPSILKKSLDNHIAVLGGVTVVFFVCVFLIGPRLGSELIPEVHQGEFNLEVALPVGTPVEKTDNRMIEIENYINEQNGVAKVAAVAGTDKTANTSSEEGEHTSKLTITVKRDRSIVDTEEELITDLRKEMAGLSGITWKVSRPALFSFKTPVEVQVHGYNLQRLQGISQELEESLKSIPGLFDIRSNIQRGNPEVQIIYNRALLSKYDLNIRNVASIVRNKIRGDVATEYKERDRRIDILVQLREDDRESISNLQRIIVNPGAPRPIPLEAVATIRVNEGPSEIRRVDQQRTAIITANVGGRDLQSVSLDIYRTLQKTQMPPDFTYELAGQNKEMATSLGSLKLALGLAIFLVYIVMASQFESLVHPLVIIFTIPLALIGVVLGLAALNIPVSIVVFLGGIMLAGIVVNNAIVLVDYINQLRDRGMKKVEAIIEAGKARLRPILMTTLTTVLGLLPMAIGIGDGAEIRTPMAITVIFGLLVSTILTLVVIPTVYSVVDRKE